MGIDAISISSFFLEGIGLFSHLITVLQMVHFGQNEVTGPGVEQGCLVSCGPLWTGPSVPVEGLISQENTGAKE